MLIASGLSYTKFEMIQLPREESAEKSDEVGTCFHTCRRYWHCHYLQTACNLFSR